MVIIIILIAFWCAIIWYDFHIEKKKETRIQQEQITKGTEANYPKSATTASSADSKKAVYDKATVSGYMQASGYNPDACIKEQKQKYSEEGIFEEIKKSYLEFLGYGKYSIRYEYNKKHGQLLSSLNYRSKIVQNYPLPPDWEEIREKVIRRDRYRCIFCGHRDNFQVHHIIYRIRGGSHLPENLITLCVYCHATMPHHENLLHQLDVDLNKQNKKIVSPVQ